MKKRFGTLLLTALVFTLALAPNSLAKTAAQKPAEIDNMYVPLSETALAVVSANRQFGFAMYKKLFDKKENLAFSPYSLSIALTLAAEGACGQTLSEMRKVLFQDKLDGETVLSGYKELLAREEPGFKAASAVFLARGMELLPSYVEKGESVFSAKVQPVDFANPEASPAINAWIKQKTNGMIEKLMDQYPIETVTMLLNAVAFEGQWAFDEFDKALTEQKTFNGTKGKQDVQMMRFSGAARGQTRSFVETKTYQAVRLSYKDAVHSMLIVLPKKGKTLKSVMDSILTEKGYAKLRQSMDSKYVDLQMPRFTMESEPKIKDALKSMGMKSAFTNGADFTRMRAQNDVTIEDVLHKARVECDEEGTKAAAATAVIIKEKTSRPPDTKPYTMVCDRPFFYMITDDIAQNPLFIGVVNHF